MSKVLVVEDDERQRAMISMILANAGYKVIEAVSVKTALMHLDVMDLSAVVLDVRLPNGHGRKVVESLIAKRDDVPVVVLTGFPEDAPTGFPVTSVLSKLLQPKCSSCGEFAAPKAERCVCGEKIERVRPFRDRLLEAIAKARKSADDIRSIRCSTRKLQGLATETNNLAN